jgi:cellulose synthase/poly-beta-1,6-N-acetylglucosamine synthase-like glycosyltransferase
MLFTIFFYVFMFISLINLLHLGMYLVGANIYDVRSFRKEKVKKGRNRRNVLVTILIPAHNEEKSIVRCLDSVRLSTVRNLEIVVIDDASTDRTLEIVNDYIRRHPDFNRPIRAIRCLENIGKAAALNRAMASGLKGEFVMTLDADSVLHPKAIQNAVDYMIDDPDVVGVAANVRVIDTTSILGLLQKFEYMVGYRSKKFYSISNSEFIVGGVASTYRYSTLKEVGFYDDDIQTEDIALSLKVASLGNKHHKLVYGYDVIAMTEGVQTFKALLRQRYRWKLGSMQSLFKHKNLFMNINRKHSKALTWYRIPMSFMGEIIVLTEPVLLAVIIYFSFLALSPQAFIGGYSLITLYLLWSIWPDEHMKFMQKLKMTGYAPVMYFLFYIMNLVQFIAVIRCIMNFDQVLRRKPTSSVWTSPERAGQTAIQIG